MEIAKDHSAQDSRMALLQACSFYGNVYGAPGAPDPSSLFGFEIHDQTVLEEGESSDNTSGSDSVKNFSFSRLPSLSGSSNSKNTAFVFEPTTNSLPEEVQSVINFKTGYDNWGKPTESLFSFEQGEYSNFDDAMDKNDVWNTKCSIDSRLSNDSNCFEMASVYGLMNTTATSVQLGEERGGWLYSGALDADESVQQFGGPDKCSDRRPFMGEEMQALKRQCTGVVKKPKHKSAPAKDPQSIAAKNRRERISERLKILQDLVPNGAKVDLVTMLEKAISYVKFLQLQVKVLATDEFWPVQGGKAPEISQVKEAIDAILSSHHKDNSCSSSK